MQAVAQRPDSCRNHLTDQPSHKQRHQNADSDCCQTDADSNYRRRWPRYDLRKRLNQRPDAHTCTNDSADQQCNSCDKQGKENGNCRHKQPKHNWKHHRRCEDDQKNPQPDRRLPSAGSAGIILCIAIRALPVRIRTVAARRLLYPLQLFLLRLPVDVAVFGEITAVTQLTGAAAVLPIFVRLAAALARVAAILPQSVPDRIRDLLRCAKFLQNIEISCVARVV